LSSKPDARRTRAVGLLCDSFGDPYSLSTMRGVVEQLHRAGLHAVSFCGGYPRAPLFSRELGGPAPVELVQGLVILSATLRDANGRLGELADGVEGPVVSIGDRLPGHANVGVNDEAAVFQSVAHLVRRHECRRIAYIAGPVGSIDGERRLAAHRLALDHFGLSADPSLMVRGNFEASSGREAAMQLLTGARGKFDAIVAANDLMAIGAVEALGIAGVRVPETVKVVGFDGIDESPFACGGLTTVAQPVVEQGIAAADLMVALLAGQPVETTPTLLSAPLLIRHTCGCHPSGGQWQTAAPLARDEVALIDGAFRETIRRQLATKRLQRELARISSRLLGARDYRALALALTEVVRLFEMRQFVLCTYAPAPGLVRVLLESSGRDVIVHQQADLVPLPRILSGGLAKREKATSLFIEPLELHEEQLGFFVVEADLAYGVCQLELRSYLAGALSRIGLMNEIRRLYSASRKERFSHAAEPRAIGADAESAIEQVVQGSSSSELPKMPT